MRAIKKKVGQSAVCPLSRGMSKRTCECGATEAKRTRGPEVLCHDVRAHLFRFVAANDQHAAVVLLCSFIVTTEDARLAATVEAPHVRSGVAHAMAQLCDIEGANIILSTIEAENTWTDANWKAFVEGRARNPWIIKSMSRVAPRDVAISALRATETHSNSLQRWLLFQRLTQRSEGMPVVADLLERAFNRSERMAGNLQELLPVTRESVTAVVVDSHNCQRYMAWFRGRPGAEAMLWELFVEAVKGNDGALVQMLMAAQVQIRAEPNLLSIAMDQNSDAMVQQLLTHPQLRTCASSALAREWVRLRASMRLAYASWCSVM